MNNKLDKVYEDLFISLYNTHEFTVEQCIEIANRVIELEGKDALNASDSLTHIIADFIEEESFTLKDCE